MRKCEPGVRYPETAIMPWQAFPLPTHFRSILRRVFNFELSSDLSETYASGLEVVVVVSAVDAIDVAGDGAGDTLAFFKRLSPDKGELIVDRMERVVPGWGSSVGCVDSWGWWRKGSPIHSPTLLTWVI